jgi:hypothetical protein
MNPKSEKLRELFEDLPVKEHWDAIEKHKGELVNIYCIFAKEHLNIDIKKYIQDAREVSMDIALESARDEACGDAENLRRLTDILTDPEYK